MSAKKTKILNSITLAYRLLESRKVCYIVSKTPKISSSGVTDTLSWGVSDVFALQEKGPFLTYKLGDRCPLVLKIAPLVNGALPTEIIPSP